LNLVALGVGIDDSKMGLRTIEGPKRLWFRIVLWRTRG